jgi:hypothetical protein
MTIPSAMPQGNDQWNRARTDFDDLPAEFLNLKGPAEGVADDTGPKQAEVSRVFQERYDSTSQRVGMSSGHALLKVR